MWWFKSKKNEKALSVFEEKALIIAKEKAERLSKWDIERLVDDELRSMIREHISYKYDREFLDKLTEGVIASFNFEETIREHFKKQVSQYLLANKDDNTRSIQWTK